jgi:hypothetical protein
MAVDSQQSDTPKKSTLHKVRETYDNGARRAILEDLFYDFHKRRGQVYWTNFVRGLFFGIGSVLGATVVIAALVWLLHLFVGVPGVGHFFQDIINTVNSYKK